MIKIFSLYDFFLLLIMERGIYNAFLFTEYVAKFYKKKRSTKTFYHIFTDIFCIYLFIFFIIKIYLTTNFYYYRY